MTHHVNIVTKTIDWALITSVGRDYCVMQKEMSSARLVPPNQSFPVASSAKYRYSKLKYRVRETDKRYQL